MNTSLATLTKSLIQFMITLVGALLGLRFILKLFAANPNNGFVNWMYETSSEILGPFRGIFPSPNLDGFVIEFSTIFALIVYSILGMLLFYIVDILTPERA